MIHQRFRRLTICGLTALLFLSPALAQTNLEKVPGYVSGAPFMELAEEGATTVKVSLHGALLKALAGIDPELKQLVGGLESIHAVILEVENKGNATKLRDLMDRTEKQLTAKRWEQLAVIRDGDSVVKLLVLNDQEVIQGLTVMVADPGENQIIFVNIAGEIDLAALAELGESLDIPGLDQLMEGK